MDQVLRQALVLGPTPKASLRKPLAPEVPVHAAVRGTGDESGRRHSLTTFLDFVPGGCYSDAVLRGLEEGRP